MAEENETTGVEIDDQPGLVPGDEHVADAPQADSSTVADVEQQPEPKNGVEQRINKITKEKYDALRQVAYLQGQLQTQQSPQQPQQQPAESELDPNDFDSTADYLKAVRVEIRNELKAEREQAQKEQQESAINSTIGQAIQQGRTKYDDFDIVTSQNIYTQIMQEAAIGENMADVMYHLGKNPEEALKIAAQPPHIQAKEIGKIEAMLAAKPPSKPPNVSKAADPPPKIPSGEAAIDAEPKTLKEKMAAWDAEVLAARR